VRGVRWLIEDRVKELGSRNKEEPRKMKDSGVEWIGKIPEDWKIQNLKSILAERNENNKPVKTDFILSLTNDRGVIPYSEKGDIGNKSKDDLTGYKLAYPNDIVLNSMNVIIGSVGLSKYYGAVSPVYYMLYPRSGVDSVRYYNYIFQTRVFQEGLKGYGNGIMEHRLRIPMTNLNTVMLPYPSAEEQQAIANYLDSKVSQIDDIIEKTKQSIEDYKKYKQSLITETVTKGLNPDVEMKDSGIEWIGEVPKKWQVYRLRDIGEIQRGTVDKNIRENEIPVKLVQYTNIYYKREQRAIDDDYLDITVTQNELQRSKVKKGDILATASSETSDDIGRSSVVIDELQNHVFGADTVRIRISDDLMYIGYKKYLLENNIYRQKFDKLCRGITRYRFNMDDFKSLKYVIPPLHEQQQIAEYLDTKCSQIDRIIDQKKTLINELETYKKSLIYECVTGKRYVG
jgi:type I restriction enzyme S subunit